MSVLKHEMLGVAEGETRAHIAQGAKTFGLLLAVAAAFVALFTGLTLLHGLIPAEFTREGMERGLATLDAEGNYPSIGRVLGHETFGGLAGDGGKIDNFTNMWMVQSADSRFFFDGDEYVNGLPYDASRRTPIEGDWMTQAFRSGWRDGDYWSGYRVFMKPLLMVVAVRGLRAIQLAFVLVSLAWALWRVWRSVGHVEAVLLFVAVMAINPANTFVDFDQAPDFIQAMFSVVTVLWMVRRGCTRRAFAILFLSLGMLEAFINCLVMPLVTLGMPLVAHLLARQKEGDDFERQLRDGLVLCLSWAMGYALAYASVWVIAGMFQGVAWTDCLMRGVRTFFARSTGEQFGLLKRTYLSVHRNVTLNAPLYWLFAFLVGALALSCCKAGAEVIRGLVPLMSASLLPLIWVVVLANHSIVHYWMVHDIFMIGIWALATCTYRLILQYARQAEG